MHLKPIRWYRDLADKEARLAAGVFLVEGPRAVEQVSSGHPSAVAEVLYSSELPDKYRGFTSRRLTPVQMRSACTSRTPQDMAAVITLPMDTYTNLLPSDPGPLILLLEDVQDPGNTGTIIRTAAAFGFSGVIMTDKCADPFSPKFVQATAGSLLSLWMRHTPWFTEQVKSLKKNGYFLLASSLSGEDDLSTLKANNKLILALGNESSGLSSRLLNLSDKQVRIPIERHRAESLNVAACAAIFMYLITAA